MRKTESAVTRAAPMFSTRGILQLYWPILIEQALSSIVGIVNSVMVSSIGMHAISAVSLVDSLNMLFLNLFNAFAAGVTVVVAHHRGRDDAAGAQATLTQSLSITVIIAAVVGVLLCALRKGALVLLFGAAEDAVMDAAGIYSIGSMLGYPFIAAFSVCAGALRATGDSRTPMLAALVSNIVNVAVGALTIYVLDWGITGAACAVFCARVSAALCVVWRMKAHPRYIALQGFTLKIKKAVLIPVVQVGIPAAVDSLVFNGGKILVSHFVSGMGTAALAANSIASNVLGICSIPGNAFSTAGVTITGRTFGARLYDETKRHLRVIPLLSSVIYGIISLLLGLWLINPLISLYNPTAEARALSIEILNLMFVAGPFIWSFAFVLPNCLRGVGDINFNTIISISSMWAFRVGGAFLFGVVMDMGVMGVWIGMILDWLCRTICFVWRMLSNRWHKRALAHDAAEAAQKAAAAG